MSPEKKHQKEIYAARAGALKELIASKYISRRAFAEPLCNEMNSEERSEFMNVFERHLRSTYPKPIDLELIQKIVSIYNIEKPEELYIEILPGEEPINQAGSAQSYGRPSQLPPSFQVILSPDELRPLLSSDVLASAINTLCEKPFKICRGLNGTTLQIIIPVQVPAALVAKKLLEEWEKKV